jgi:outer membrane protein TolC
MQTQPTLLAIVAVSIFGLVATVFSFAHSADRHLWGVHRAVVERLRPRCLLTNRSDRVGWSLGQERDQSSSLANLLTGPSGTWNFAPQVTQPIFAVGLKSSVKLAKGQRELALAQYQQKIQTSFREVSDALVQYRKVKEVRLEQEQLVTTLRDRSRLAHLRYEGGVDTLLNALDADRDLFNAQLSVTQTKRNELLSLVQLYKALGGGWQ